jgi:chitin synthase
MATPGGMVEVDVAAEPSDIDSNYLVSLENLRSRKPITKPLHLTLSENEQATKDYYANVRTNVKSVHLVLSDGPRLTEDRIFRSF